MITLTIDGLVIGDSKEKKRDAVGYLTFIRTVVEDGYRRLSSFIQGFDQRATSLQLVLEHMDKLPVSCR
jgi:hypothetical protein